MIKFYLALLTVCALSCNSTPVNKTGSNSMIDSGLVKMVPSEPEHTYKHYCNGRFNYCIDYPAEILFAQPEPTNGDGCAFKNKRAEEILSVAGSYVDESEGIDPLASSFESDRLGLSEENGNNGRVITYQKLGKTFFVVSGYKDGKIFYHKTIRKDNILASAQLQYPEAEKELYDNVSKKIFHSFK